MKVIVKRPEEQYGEIREIENTLEALQKIVGGWIECVYNNGSCIICNEEGKLQGLAPNIWFKGDILVGTIIVCGIKGEDFDDVKIPFDKWKEFCDDMRVISF